MSAVSSDSPAGHRFSHLATMGSLRFIETSGEINEFMKMHVINLIKQRLRQVGKRLYGAKIAIMGLAYKMNINDFLESPTIKNIKDFMQISRLIPEFRRLVSVEGLL